MYPLGELKQSFMALLVWDAVTPVIDAVPDFGRPETFDVRRGAADYR